MMIRTLSGCSDLEPVSRDELVDDWTIAHAELLDETCILDPSGLTGLGLSDPSALGLSDPSGLSALGLSGLTSLGLSGLTGLGLSGLGLSGLTGLTGLTALTATISFDFE